MSEQKTHAEIIAEQLTNIESLGDELPAVIAAGALRKLLRHLDEAHRHELDEMEKQVADLQQQLPKPDPNWRDICAKCFENGATEPPDCKYYTEDGCMSPIPDQHPLIQVGNAAKLRETISTLRTALKEIRNDVLDMVMNHKSEDPDSYAHGLCLSIGGACDMALNSTKEFDDGNE